MARARVSRVVRTSAAGLTVLVAAGLIGSAPASGETAAAPGSAPAADPVGAPAALHPRTASTPPLTATAAAAIPAATAGVIAAYTLVAPRSVSDSGLTARAVVPAGASCPTLETTRTTASGRSVTRDLRMRLRVPGPTTAPAFASVSVCQRDLPSGATKARIGGRTVPAALPTTVDSIALFGDTGCSIWPGLLQDCAGDRAWPLARISQRIADERPDVVVNLGDFYYREAACPASAQALCGGSPPPVTGLPFEDTDYGWLAEFVVPMTPMLSVAPLLALRGNHEACNRAGNGYFLFLDPRPDTAATCAPTLDGDSLVAPPPQTTPTWATTLRLPGGRTLRLAVVDSAYGDDAGVNPWAATLRPLYQDAADLTADRPGRESWLLTHRPMFGLVSTTLGAPYGPSWTPWSSLDQAAASIGLLGTYDLILSSHLHLAQAVQLPGQPGQLVLGNGGTLLDPPTGYAIPPYGPLADPAGNPVVPGVPPYPTASSAWTSVTFGYAMAEPGSRAGRWSITQMDPQGEAYATCSVRSRTIACADG